MMATSYNLSRLTSPRDASESGTRIVNLFSEDWSRPMKKSGSFAPSVRDFWSDEADGFDVW